MNTKIKLKNIRHSPTLSEETFAFTADVYFDGKLIGYAENHGQGGETIVDWYDHDLFLRAEEYAKSLPEVKEFNFQPPLATVVDMEVEKHLIWTDIVRDCKRGVLVFDKGEKFIYKFKKTMTEKDKAKAIETIRNRGEMVINGMAKETALGLAMSCQYPA